ncbi:EF-hand domain-containing protein [Streptomyces sp. NBC_00342]|uniref:EF-hand domain-containing protein n=1 Tax=Streptomyces sp. NBC_00342 TaxID=2975718 RepID=UPI002E2C064F|nr:EF-hand domain-containing protein [Streptomyces sp. NBC_00342]
MTTAVTDPITIKLDRMFAATDTDGDGYVDWSDHERLVDRYRSAGPPTWSPAHARC